MENSRNIPLRSPLVSVIVAVYNVEKYIEACLESILNQSYDNWEAIVVNDGSTDASLKICESYARVDSRFIVITTENGGSSNARNHGLDLARGEYVMMVDGDDLLMPDAIENSVSRILSLGVDILCTSCVSISEDANHVLREVRLSSMGCLDSMSALKMIHDGRGSIIPGIWAKIYRAEILKDVRFNLKLRMAQDVYFNTELLLRSPSITIATTDCITYQYRIRESSVSHSRPATKIQPYLEEMSNLICQFAGTCDASTLSLMANSVCGVIVSHIIRKPILGRYPDEWSLKIINQLMPLISDDRYKRLTDLSKSHLKSIMVFTKWKFLRIKKRTVKKIKCKRN